VNTNFTGTAAIIAARQAHPRIRLRRLAEARAGFADLTAELEIFVFAE
jgi:hypothetical protein